MRNLLPIGAASVALFGAAQAMAADSTVIYDIEPTCEVQDLSGTLRFNDLTVGGRRFRGFGGAIPPPPPPPAVAQFTLICDDPNGATLTLASANGGLQSSEDPSLIVGYRAVAGPALRPPPPPPPPGSPPGSGSGSSQGPSFSLTAILEAQGTPVSSSTSFFAQAELANPNERRNAQVAVSATSSFLFSGTYTDTLSINVSGNP